MTEVKLVLSDKSGKSYQTTADVSSFSNKKIGEKLKDIPNFSGYELQITGGSDTAGFPMRWDVEGVVRKKPLLTSGPGVHIKRKGMKKRKTVRGNTVSSDIAQINVKVLTEGKKSLKEMFGKEEPKEEAKVEEASKEEAKEQPKAEEKKPEAEKPAEKPKESPKAEENKEKPKKE